MTATKPVILTPAERAALEPIAASPLAWVPLAAPRPIHYDLERRGMLELRTRGVDARRADVELRIAHLTDRGREALAAREPLIVFHGRCMDGFTAAWAAWRFFEARAELMPASYGDAPPADVAGRDVFVLDFSYPRAELEALARGARSLLVLDHHRSAQEALEGLPFARFDMHRSGAALAWDHFFGGPATGRPRPWIVEYVQDRDLWTWQLPRSREVSAYLRSLPTGEDIDADLERWNDLAARDRVAEVAPLGAAILAYQEQVIRDACRRAGVARLPGVDVEVPCVNATELVSEIGNELAREAPFAIVWHEDGNGARHYSLRSCGSNPAHADVAAIARELGGGGHRHAAGFHVPAAVHQSAPTLGL